MVQQVRDLTKGGVNHSFEVLGRKETAEQAFAYSVHLDVAAGGIERCRTSGVHAEQPRAGTAQPLQVGYASRCMFATVAPGLLEVIGIPVGFVVLTAAAFTGVYILWMRARS